MNHRAKESMRVFPPPSSQARDWLSPFAFKNIFMTLLDFSAQFLSFWFSEIIDLPEYSQIKSFLRKKRKTAEMEQMNDHKNAVSLSK